MVIPHLPRNFFLSHFRIISILLWGPKWGQKKAKMGPNGWLKAEDETWACVGATLRKRWSNTMAKGDGDGYAISYTPIS